MKRISATRITEVLPSILAMALHGGCGGEAADRDDADIANSQNALTSPHHPEFRRKVTAVSTGKNFTANPAALWTATSLEGICGTNNLQHVNSYAGTHGATKAFVDYHQLSVGAMTPTDDPGDGKYCSGTLIAKDLFLTASHCVGVDTIGQYVAFNYQYAKDGKTLLPQDHFQIIGISVDGVGRNLDYAVLFLDGAPGDRYATTLLRAEDPDPAEQLTIIQHPKGEPKQVDSGTFSSLSGDYMRYGNIDTEGGSSGSGVLDADGRLIAVHTNGGCTATGGFNKGVRLSRIFDRVP